MAQFLGLPKVQYFDGNGDPLSGGKLYTYEVGTTTNKATYPTIADALAATNANANPVVLDSRGEADVVLAGSTKLVLKTSADVTIWTVDNVSEDTTLVDSNGNEVIKLTAVASAVNYIEILNAATGNRPTIKTQSEVDIGIDFVNSENEAMLKVLPVASAVNCLGVVNAITGAMPKLTAEGEADTGIIFANSEGEEILILDSIASSVNEFTVSSAATASGPILEATGSDANIDVNFQAKGTGLYNFKATSTAAAGIALHEDTDNGTNYVKLLAPTTVASNKTWTLYDTDVSNAVVQRVSTQTGASATGTTLIPYDDTIPQNTEGTEYMTLAITPKSTSNILKIEVVAMFASSVGTTAVTTALFQDTTANALAAMAQYETTAGGTLSATLTHTMSAGTTSATTFKVRIGQNNAGTLTFNGGGGTRNLGGVAASSIVITEYAA